MLIQSNATPAANDNNGLVKVVHGANDGTFPLAGCRVGAVRASLMDAFNLPHDAIAFVNGEPVDPCYFLRPDDTLEFCKQGGSKGIRRMLTQAEIRQLYTGFPPDVLEDLFKTVRHDDTNAQGGPIWFESSVDEWLDERYARKRADDGRDKVIPPGGCRIDGQEYGGLTRQEWLLMEVVLASRSAGVGGVKVGDVIEHMWGHDAEDKENALKQAIKRLNEKLTKQNCPLLVSQENGFVALVP